jgi:hypothetical protein
VRPVPQTLFGDGSDGRPAGDCFRACVASLLELPIEEVPHVVEDHVRGGTHWAIALNRWLRPRGLGYVEMPAQGSSCYGMLDVSGGYYVASGPGPRGYPHAVIEREGVLAHDPHPSGAGLLKVERFGVIFCRCGAP